MNEMPDTGCSDLLEPLNEQQREAVLINEGSLLVFAGAGSGKTRVITTKIAWIIRNGIARPWEILAVTFTNKACNEMRERVSELVGEETASQCIIKTFHSFGIWLLRRYPELAGLSPGFSIYDESDSASLLHQCFPQYPRKDTDAMARRISALKDRMEKPSVTDEVYEFYNVYQRKLLNSGAVDFPDMILRAVSLINDNPDVMNWVHSRFKAILVDEYQDSNTAQFNLLRLLTGPQSFVCVVGDDDQSIYRFRGAKVENILEFEKQFENTKKVVLGCNYRCSAPILACARDVITKNTRRADKELTAFNAEGPLPVLYYEKTDADEAQNVINIIKQGSPSLLGSTAVIYRTNAQSKIFEKKFPISGIPYVLVGAFSFYEREEVKDVIALISLLVNPCNSVAFERMINKPSRGIGASTLAKITENVDNPVLNCRTLVENGTVRGRAAEGIASFLKAYDRCSELLGKSDNAELVRRLISEFGIENMYRQRDEEENYKASRTENLNQIVNSFIEEPFCSGIEGIEAFLEEISLDPASFGSQEGAEAQEEQRNAVTLITMHNTKGLEFDRVFIVGLEDEIFPSLRENSVNADLEEERRICYVAFTRAKRELYLSTCAERLTWGFYDRHSPSRFLSEIEPEHLKVVRHTFSDGRRRHGTGYYSGYGYSGYRGYAGFSSKTEKPGKTGKSTDVSGSVLIKKSNRSADVPHEVIKWEKGDRVYSDIMGNGTVTKISKFGENDVLTVVFDSGKMGNYVAAKANLAKL